MNRLSALIIGAFFLSCGIGCGIANAAPAPQMVAGESSTSIIKGTVTDEKGDPIIGASVTEAGTTRGTVTDIEGHFSLKAGVKAKLQISFVGYKTVNTTAEDGLNVVLKEDKALLDEVVVVAYGRQKKVNLTGAVATVDIDKTMGARPEQDVSKALQGAAPGLSVINTNGDINGQPTLTIRGLGTLSNGATSSPYIIVDGVPMDDISYLNTNDIASISVLKDAASTSIYGARAAFGVILITTKTAKKGDKVQVNYTNNFAWDNSTYLPDYPDVPTQLTAAIQAKKRVGQQAELFGMDFESMLPYAKAWEAQHGNSKASYREMVPFTSMDNVGDFYITPAGKGLYYADWDVKGIMYRNWAPSNSQNVNIQGSTGKTNYYVSFGYDNKEGIMKFNPDKLKKYTVTANLTTDVTDWLQVGMRLRYGNRRYDSPNTRRNTYQYTWRWGSFFGPYGTADGMDFRNDIAYRKQAATQEMKSYHTGITGFLKANVTKDLTVNADYTYNIMHRDIDGPGFTVYGLNSWNQVIYKDGAYTPSYFNNPAGTYAYNSSARRSSWVLNVYANWEHTFAKVHTVGVMLGANGESKHYRFFDAQRMALADQNHPDLSFATGNQTVSSDRTSSADAGYFGRVNYNYNDILLLEFNGRYDGSSRFPTDDRWAFFPSGSLGYRFSQEKYFEPLRSFWSNGKFRVSYGEVGNEAVGDDMFVSTITTTSADNVHWLDASGVKVVEHGMPSLVASSLSWERIKSLNLGLDLGFFNDELTASFDWFQRKTCDMLAPGKTLPATLGDDAPYTNAGSLRSRGWEINIDWRHNFNKDFGVYVNVNLSDAKVKVVDWTDDSRLLNTNYSGKNYGDIWGFETDRYFETSDFVLNSKGLPTAYAKGVADQSALETGNFAFGPGDIKYKDLNGDGFINAGKGTAEDHGDLKVIGNSLPRYEYSFHIGGNYKGFDLDMFFQGVGKRSVWTRSSFAFPMMRDADAALFAHQTSYNGRDVAADGTVTYTINQGNDYPCLFSGNDGYGVYSATVMLYGCNNYYPQSRYLVNMAYLRFKNLTVGYTLPKDIIHKIYLQKLRVYFSGNNICNLYKASKLPLDPEINEGAGEAYGGWGRTAPITRSISFGLQATF
jgi:TonB-linked SusC/RagA family outer membrane protein